MTLNASPGSTSASTVTGMPGRMRASWLSLKFASTHSPCDGHQRDELRADCRIGPGARTAIADRAVDRRAQFGVAEVELGGVAVGDGASQCGGVCCFCVSMTSSWRCAASSAARALASAASAFWWSASACWKRCTDAAWSCARLR